MLEVEICNIPFKNPVIAASGTFGFGRDYEDFYDPSILGGICTKGLTFNKRQGNKGERMCETPSGMLNSVGLQNPGVNSFIKNELASMEKIGSVIIANLGGSTLEEYEEGVIALNNTSVSMIELNISCPNVKSGGMAFGIKSEDAYNIVKRISNICKKPLMVKLSPNARDIVEMGEAVCEAGADAISLVNTFKAMAIDINKRKPVFDNTTAGLSGPSIKPIALRMVYEVSKKVKVPVVGLGGIVTAKDAIEFIMAGATAIEVGTANFMNPFVMRDIILGMEDFMVKNGIKNLEEIRGII